jgi:glycosyltransferase involved in cell wall biosynthesis
MIQAIENPLISVALPILNGMPHLKNAMDGLMAQTYTHFELVVQDSLSTDGAVEYLHSLDTAFPIHVASEKDDSLADGYSRAFKRCTGDLVVIAGCDEYFDPDAFAKYVSWYRANPDAVMIYGGSRLVDSDGRTLSEARSSPFDLIDYVRFHMCPTQAGVYNRSILGEDLYFDPSIALCPDYDLIIRMALKYGPNRLRFVNDVTMSARADESSMSFRPELYAKFADFKLGVIDDLLSGRYAETFAPYLRRDFAFRLYFTQAKIAHSVTGDTAHFRELALKANGALPGHPLLRFLADLSPGLMWSGPAHGLEERVILGPSPPEARTVFEGGPETVDSPPYWRRAGTELKAADGGAKLTTAPLGWQYGAMIPLDFSGVNLRTQHAWVRLKIRAVHGEILCGFYDPNFNEISLEALLPQGDGPAVHEVELSYPVGAAILLRTGPSGERASAVIEAVEIKVLDKAGATAGPKTDA